METVSTTANNPIDILVTTYHRQKFTQLTIDSIRERTKTPYRLIVVDNGSSSDMRQMLFDYQMMGVIKVLILLDRNYGLEYAKNTGLRFVQSQPYFVNTDNDLIIQDSDPDWLSQMVSLMDRHKEFGAIAARPQCLLGVVDIFKDEEHTKHLTEDGEVGFFYGGDGPCGGVYRIMRTDAVKKTGWRDDDTSQSRSEEWRICGELKRQGLLSGYARYIRAYHLFGQENWGYDRSQEHYHVSHDYGEPKDVGFDSKTCKPLKGEQWGHE